MKTPLPGQRYKLRRPKLRASHRDHYALVVYVTTTHATINWMSSEFDLFDENHDLKIETGDEGFKASGLKTTTYLIFEAVIEETHSFFEGELAGHIEAEIKEKIERWWGTNIS